MADARDLLGRSLMDLVGRISSFLPKEESTDDARHGFRGLYLTERKPSAIIASFFEEGFGAMDFEDGVATQFEALGSAFELHEIETELILEALAPDLDTRFAKLYSFLNEDTNSDYLTVGLFLTLVGANPLRGDQYDLFGPNSSLTKYELIEIEEVPGRSHLSARIRVPASVASFCMGQTVPDESLQDLLQELLPFPEPLAGEITTVVSSEPLVYVRDSSTFDGSPPAQAIAAIAANGLKPVAIRLSSASVAHRPARLARLLAREARLKSLGLLIGPAELIESVVPGSIAEFAEISATKVFFGAAAWDPAWSPSAPKVIELEELSLSQARFLWKEELGDALGENDVDEIAAVIRLPASSIRRVTARALADAKAQMRQVTLGDVRQAVRFEHSSGFESGARRIEPAVGWDKLVVSSSVLQQLRELCDRVRSRETVFTEWRMRSGGGRTGGVAAMFAGDSGTGKTMSAEVLAHDLGVDLYTINLATIVDKYIGETEKNLERLFSQAKGVNGILFFDEADAIFGKRSEVKDARDRYANTEVAYLLQRIESFGGVIILATNLRSNLDEAFTRRLDMIIEFPKPSPEERKILWQRTLIGKAPLDDDIDWQYLAESFDISGGNIANVAITAAHLAAARDRAIGMLDLTKGLYYEYRKLGRLVVESEFGPWLAKMST